MGDPVLRLQHAEWAGKHHRKFAVLVGVSVAGGNYAVHTVCEMVCSESLGCCRWDMESITIREEKKT